MFRTYDVKLGSFANRWQCYRLNNLLYSLGGFTRVDGDQRRRRSTGVGEKVGGVESCWRWRIGSVQVGLGWRSPLASKRLAEGGPCSLYSLMISESNVVGTKHGKLFNTRGICAKQFLFYYMVDICLFSVIQLLILNIIWIYYEYLLGCVLLTNE